MPVPPAACSTWAWVRIYEYVASSLVESPGFVQARAGFDPRPPRLRWLRIPDVHPAVVGHGTGTRGDRQRHRVLGSGLDDLPVLRLAGALAAQCEIGRASCRER